MAHHRSRDTSPEPPGTPLGAELEYDEVEPWNVVLLDDDHNTFAYVIFVLQEVLACDRSRAEEICWSTNNDGSAVIQRAARPVAEATVSTLATWALSAALER